MLSRGLALLGAYRTGELELSQIELGRRTNLPKPTVHRLVAELVEWGALERTATGIRLGSWLYQLGEEVPRIGLLRTIGQPYLDRLHKLTRQHTCLSVLLGDRTLNTAWSGPAAWQQVGHGSTPGMVGAAALRALLAAESGPETFLAHATLGESAHSAIPLPRGSQPKSYHLASAAIPVTVLGVTVAAISVVGHADTFNIQAYGTHLRSTATAFGRRLSLTAVFAENSAEA
jgi:DNA-binding IclR family transcriptional regulator